MSKKHKTPAHTNAAQYGSQAQAKEATQSLSSLADLRFLYQELKAEAILARQASVAMESKSTKQSLAGAASPQQITSQASALTLSKQTGSPLTPQTSVRLASARHQKMTFDQRLSDDYEPVLARYKDGSLYFCKPGVGPDVARKLWQRKLDIQAQIDLHGLRLDEARSAIIEFVEDAVQDGLRCMRVIHGKGFGSANQKPALKGRVYTWLAQLREVLAFCEARPHEGGAGAVIVLLRSARRAGYTDY